MKTVAFLIILVFAVFGFSEFLHIIKSLFNCKKAKTGTALVVDLKDGIAEKQVIYVCENLVWYGKRQADRVVFKTDNIDEKTRENCRNIALKFGIKFDL